MKTLPKYITICKQDGRYRVEKRVKRKLYFIGRFSTLEEAKKALADFDVNDYQTKPDRKLPQNVYARDDKFVVQLYSNNKTLYCGTFDTVEEAIVARDNKKEELFNV